MDTQTQGEELISCLCITHQRVPMLQRAVACFRAQTWQRREMVVLHEERDTSTGDYLTALADPMIRQVVIPTLPRMTIGARRQLTVDSARGTYVATWDDDDWSAPTRLADSMQAIRSSGRPVCTMERWIVHDQMLKQTWLSARRPWEASMVAELAALPRYRDVDRAEDYVVVQTLLAQQKLVGLRNPNLYIYLYHGRNIGSRTHFKRNVFAHAVRLSDAFSARVAGLLAEPLGTPLQPDELTAALPPGLMP